eukprot:COSAG02_NODE_6390_length_3604_cov_1.766049_2_plen_72_part_00
MCVVLEAMLGRGAAAIEEIKSIPVSEFNVFVLEKILLRYPIADCQLHIIMINGPEKMQHYLHCLTQQQCHT